MKCAATLLLVISIPMCQATSRLQASPRISMQKASAHNRVMQYSGGFIYRANYTAQFQYLRDSICFGPQPPVIEVSCIGPNIQLLGTSDPSIVCGPVTTNTDGTSHITCNNTCASTADCQKVYLAQESVTNSYNGPFGEVRFVCEGNTTYDVDAVVKLDGSGNGGCAAASFTRNYQIARMGISCPTQSGDRTYNFDDYFFFCGGTGAGTYSTYAGEAMPGNVFTCYTGTDCNGTACDIVYDQISIYTNLFNVWETCVESTVQITPFPTPAPPDPTQPQLHPISARFQAAWGLLSDPVFGTSACSVNTPTVQITCLHGYNLTFVTTTSATSNCTTVNRSAIECIEYNTSSFVNQFTGVVYECSGPKTPAETMVEYPEDTGFCSGNSKATIFRHAVQLGPYCDPGTGAGARFLFNAPVVVCADQISQFELLNEFAINTGTKNDRYTCTKSATFPSGSTASETKTIPRLGILTSFNWAISPSYGICYKVGGTNSSASLAPTPAVAQTSATPSASLSHVPSSPSPVRSPLGLIMLPSEPTRNPALPPQSAPSQPSASTSSVQDKSSSSSSSADGPSVGAVVGGAIAALVCLCIIALVIVRRKSSRGSSPRGQNKGLGNNVDNNEDRPPTTDTDRNIEGLFPQRQLDFVAKQSIVAPSSRVTTKKNGVDNDMATAASATTASATASSAHDQSGSSQTPRYKDQVRPAVWDPTPLVNATALGDLDSPDIQVAQLVAVEPVPTVPTVVATSPEQNARRRPAAEPAGHHVDEPRDDDDDDMPTVN